MRFLYHGTLKVTISPFISISSSFLPRAYQVSLSHFFQAFIFGDSSSTSELAFIVQPIVSTTFGFTSPHFQPVSGA